MFTITRKRWYKLTTFTLEIQNQQTTSSACTCVLEKHFQKIFKNGNFLFFDFLQNINLEVRQSQVRFEIIEPTEHQILSTITSKTPGAINLRFPSSNRQKNKNISKLGALRKFFSKTIKQL